MEIILDSYGTYVQMKNKMLLVKPKDKENIYVPMDKLRSVVISPGIRITSDVLFSLMHHKVDVVMMTRRGNVKGRVWNHQFGSIADIRRNQLKLANKPVACRWVLGMIMRKIYHQKELISRLYTMNIDEAQHPGKTLEKMQNCINTIELLPTHSILTIDKKLRNLEARAAQYYWSWTKSLIPAVYRFPGRVPRRSADPVNSMLSYGYGMLYHKIESAIIKAGLDPEIGWFHKTQHNKPVLTYDLVEPFRMWVDTVVFELSVNKTIPILLFQQKDNVFEMTRAARKILAVRVNKYLDQKEKYDGKYYKRDYILFLEAQSLASKVKSSG